MPIFQLTITDNPCHCLSQSVALVSFAIKRLSRACENIKHEHLVQTRHTRITEFEKILMNYEWTNTPLLI